MNPRSVVFAIGIACCALLPATAAGQQARDGAFRDVLRPAAWGALAGLGLAVAYVEPTGESWLLSDEAAVPLAVAAGMGAAFLARSAAARRAPSERSRTGLRMAVGTGSAMDWDYSLAFRAPAGDRLALDAAILVINDTRQTIETETRCGLFGCITGDYITGFRYQQALAAVVRGVYPLSRESRWHPTLALGGGPAAVHVRAPDEVAARHTGLLLDGALAVERGAGRTITAETGFRVIPLGGGADADIDNAAWYVRIGLAWGG